MIPLNEKTVEVKTNVSSDATGQFTVDESALGHIMDVLTNLYSDPEGAVTREYLTNAFDSQVEAGMKPGTKSWKPIEVTTPSHFNKAYKIRDFGVGMSVDDLTNTYSKYGKSTKTDSNDVVGMLGLGSKCALTYTNSFTITGWKGGVKTTAIVSKNEENIPVFMVVDTRASDEPSGVEISVPVKDRNSFSEKTAKFLQYWTPGLVLVDGKAPTHHGLTKVQDTKITYKVSGDEVKGVAEVYMLDGGDRYNQPTSKVVMGNVAYEVPYDYVPSDLREAGIGFVAYVPMGAVSFPPSREKLMLNPGTKAVLSAIGVGLFNTICEQKFTEVKNAGTFAEAYRMWRAIPYNFQRHKDYAKLSYQGHSFPTYWDVKHLTLWQDYNGNGKINQRGRSDYNTLINADSTLFVTGVPYESKPTSYFKKKVFHYLDEKGLAPSGIRNVSVFLIEKDVIDPWLTQIPRVSADTIKAIKLPSNPSAPRTEATYDVYRKTSTAPFYSMTGETTVKVKKGERIVYISPTDMRETYRKSGTRADVLLKYLPDDCVLVVLGTNRFEKFLRTHPNAVKAGKVLQERVDALVKATSDHEYIVQNLDYSEREFLSKVDFSLIDDPDLVELAKIVQGHNKSKKKTDNYAEAQQIVSWSPRASIRLNLPERKHVANTVSKNYPLINHVGNRHKAHMVIYVNAVFQETQQAAGAVKP